MSAYLFAPCEQRGEVIDTVQGLLRRVGLSISDNDLDVLLLGSAVCLVI